MVTQHKKMEIILRTVNEIKMLYIERKSQKINI